MSGMGKKLDAGNIKEGVAGRIGELTRPTGEEDLMHVRLERPRLRLSRVQVAVAGFVALLAGVAYFFAGGPEEVVAPAEVGVAGQAEASTLASPVVAVVGDVPTPGLHTLTPGARVADALLAASEGIDLTAPQLGGLNLAERLSDGAQIRVPFPGEPVAQAPPGEGKLNLNQATAEQLTALKGIGPKTAEAIVAHRESIGSFSSVEQLLDIQGIGPAKLAAIKEEVTV